MSTSAQLQAWNDIQPHLTERQEQVYQVIRARGDGATLRDICDALDIEMNQASGRVSELCELKCIRDSGRKRVNHKSGREITVWVAVGPGQIGLFQEA
jgi:hypothetical protein